MDGLAPLSADTMVSATSGNVQIASPTKILEVKAEIDDQFEGYTAVNLWWNNRCA